MVDGLGAKIFDKWSEKGYCQIDLCFYSQQQGGAETMDFEQSAESLRKALLEEIYAGAASGLGAMLLDEEEVRRAGPEELEQIARQYGIK